LCHDARAQPARAQAVVCGFVTSYRNNLPHIYCASQQSAHSLTMLMQSTATRATPPCEPRRLRVHLVHHHKSPYANWQRAGTGLALPASREGRRRPPLGRHATPSSPGPYPPPPPRAPRAAVHSQHVELQRVAPHVPMCGTWCAAAGPARAPGPAHTLYSCALVMNSSLSSLYL
jgi:hypothetical protein